MPSAEADFNSVPAGKSGPHTVGTRPSVDGPRRTLALGDVHGAARALDQVLDRCGFNPDTDRLICLGDTVDGWPDVPLVLDRLCAIPDLVYCLGNHDLWFLWWLTDSWPDPWEKGLWIEQGGRATYNAYGGDPANVPRVHRELFRSRAVRWHVQDGAVFVHAGWNWRIFDHPRGDDQDELLWDRELWRHALGRQLSYDAMRRGRPEVGPLSPLTRWREVFVGHSSTTYPPHGGSDRPLKGSEVWNLDQGAGWKGRLTIMDVTTHEYWQSDTVQDLYPGVEGRG